MSKEINDNTIEEVQQVDKPTNQIDKTFDDKVEDKKPKKKSKAIVKNTDQHGNTIVDEVIDPEPSVDPVETVKEEPEVKKESSQDEIQKAIDKRIAKVIAKQKEAEDKYNKLLEEHESFKKKIPVDDKEPEFDTYEQLFEHLYEKKVAAERENTNKQRAAQEAENAKNGKLLSKLQEIEKASPGFIKEMQDSPILEEFPSDLEDFIRESDVGPHIIKHFIDNEDDLENYKNLSEKGREKYLWKMEMRLENNIPVSKKNNHIEDDEEEVTTVREYPKKGNLIKKPITPIRNSSVSTKKFFKNALEAAQELNSKELMKWIEENG